MLDQANFYADEIEKMEAELEQLRRNEQNILTMSKERSRVGHTLESAADNSIASP